MSVGLEHRLLASDYRRADCEIGIVHVGYGAFHRAHQAVFVDAFMQATGDLGWGIAAVNLRAAEHASFAEAAAAEDGYVLKTMSPQRVIQHRVIRPHIAFRDWTVDAAAAEALIAQPSVHLVTITVTESGYYLDDAGGLNKEDPVIRAELDGGAQGTVYAYLVNGLRRRMESGGVPLSILCCDNIRGNGRMLRRNLGAYLDAIGSGELRAWVGENVTFPCSMVDRITPKPKPRDSDESRKLFGRLDDQTVMAEDFIQWVIEDDFAGRRPRLEDVGVTVTRNVDPYEEAKIRILNGGHTGLTYLAALSGHQTFDQAMADPKLADHFWRYETDEVLAALDIALPFDKADYLGEVADRFRNANIGDTIERICTDGYAKFPVFIRPTLEGCARLRIRPVHGIRSVASWYVFSRRWANGTSPFTYHEPNWSSLKPLIKDGNLAAFANSELLWADFPRKFPEFRRLLETSIEEVETTWPEQPYVV